MERSAGGGTVEALVAKLPEPARTLLQAVRAGLHRLGGVSEKIVFDYDAQEESPAFYVGARQLCHVHVAVDHIEVTISLSRGLTFEVLRARDVPDAIRGVVERTREYGATRWVSVPIRTREELEGLLALAHHKHRFLVQGGGELAVPKDQTTLEKFA